MNLWTKDPSRSVSSMGNPCLTLHSLVLAIYSVFCDFAPIPMYRDTKTTLYHPYIESATAVSDNLVYSLHYSTPGFNHGDHMNGCDYTFVCTLFGLRPCCHFNTNIHFLKTLKASSLHYFQLLRFEDPGNTAHVNSNPAYIRGLIFWNGSADPVL